MVGGVRWLTDWGREHPNHFANLLGKMIPQEVHASLELRQPMRILNSLRPQVNHSGDLEWDVDWLITDVIPTLTEADLERVRNALAIPHPQAPKSTPPDRSGQATAALQPVGGTTTAKRPA